MTSNTPYSVDLRKLNKAHYMAGPIDSVVGLKKDIAKGNLESVKINWSHLYIPYKSAGLDNLDPLFLKLSAENCCNPYY